MTQYSNSKYQNNPNSVWSKISNFINSNTLILDIGCSSGNFGSEITKRKKCIVDGIEIDNEDATIATTKLRRVWNIDIERDQLPKEMERYDYIYLGDVIEHLVDPVNVLRKIKSLIKNNGKLLFSVPNMAHILTRITIMKGEFGCGETGLLDKTHLHFYDTKEILRVINDAGYSIEKLDYVNREVPGVIIKNELNNIGLSASKKFYKMSKSLEATSYQICGIATPTKGVVKKTKLPKVYPPVNEMTKHINKLNKLHQNDTKRVIRHYERLLNEEKQNREMLEARFRKHPITSILSSYKRKIIQKVGKND